MVALSGLFGIDCVEASIVMLVLLLAVIIAFATGIILVIFLLVLVFLLDSAEEATARLLLWGVRDRSPILPRLIAPLLLLCVSLLLSRRTLRSLDAPHFGLALKVRVVRVSRRDREESVAVKK